MSSDLNETMALIEPLRADPSRTRARASAALEAPAGRAEVDSFRIAAIGFCFDARSWTEMRAFLDEIFRSSQA